MQPLHIARFTATSCLGAGTAPLAAALAEGRSGLAPCRFDTVQLDTFVGEAPGVDAVVLPHALQAWDCRNNRLAWLGLQQDGFAAAVAAARERHGPRRVGVFLGTSTSGILQTEHAYRRRDAETGALPPDFHYAETHNTYSVAGFVRAALQLQGPAAAVSSACSSSAKVFASARRLIEAGVIDAAVVGGVDTLCLTTLYGFHSLGLLSPEPCRPSDPERRGISVSEAAAYALIERVPASLPADAVLLAGVGESSDAHHMSAPHPEGRGARAAMEGALATAGLRPEQIGYINLHGTATPANDAAEGLAVAALFGERSVPASSTKGATGHSLGAAGGLEAVIAALALQQGLLPASAGTRSIDPAISLDIVLTPRRQAIDTVLTNSFGFGGSNSSLVLRRAG